MYINQLTKNWTTQQALDAVTAHCDAPAIVDNHRGILVNRGGKIDDETGWTALAGNDAATILAEHDAADDRDIEYGDEYDD